MRMLALWCCAGLGIGWLCHAFWQPQPSLAPSSTGTVRPVASTSPVNVEPTTPQPDLVEDPSPRNAPTRRTSLPQLRPAAAALEQSHDTLEAYINNRLERKSVGAALAPLAVPTPWAHSAPVTHEPWGAAHERLRNKSQRLGSVLRREKVRFSILGCEGLTNSGMLVAGTAAEPMREPSIYLAKRIASRAGLQWSRLPEAQRDFMLDLADAAKSEYRNALAQVFEQTFATKPEETVVGFVYANYALRVIPGGGRARDLENAIADLRQLREHTWTQIQQLIGEDL